MARSDEQTNVRIPADLKTYILERAKAERRSLTAEVVTRLEQSRQREQKEAARQPPH